MVVGWVKDQGTVIAINCCIPTPLLNSHANYSGEADDCQMTYEWRELMVVGWVEDQGTQLQGNCNQLLYSN